MDRNERYFREIAATARDRAVFAGVWWLLGWLGVIDATLASFIYAVAISALVFWITAGVLNLQRTRRDAAIARAWEV